MCSPGPHEFGKQTWRAPSDKIGPLKNAELIKIGARGPFCARVKRGAGQAINVTLRARHVAILALDTGHRLIRVTQAQIGHEGTSVHSSDPYIHTHIVACGLGLSLTQ